ncbi:MAG: glycosyl transferase [Bacteroidota bacterium]|nr:MAG: glycosyltransferase [Bacteroidetes bacterium OLB12]GIL22672.1 MAG: glycosyl transferase [Bacteroidota bacterium]HNU42833.1 glycosyltransferase [Cyclobacteriaceae bacterium]
MTKKTTRTKSANHLLIEVAWEVCNQVGGIYTVIRSKAPAMTRNHSGHYCMVGPYLNKNILAELEPLDDTADVFGLAAANLRKRGYEVMYADWLITGKPRVILLNPNVVEEKVRNVIKYLLWKNHAISTPDKHALIDQVIGFAYLTKLFVDELVKIAGSDYKLLAHFHEWMAGLPILDIKREELPVRTIFTTHATQLGRHLAINSPLFYAHLPFFKWEDEAGKFGVETEAAIEYGCAQKCDVMTTVSDVTARECKHLLRRKPDFILPNGLNIQRFEALHEFQNLHSQYKEQIHEFVMGHFFSSYGFDLNKTIYFFTSGRYEYKNKGFDLTLEALVHLNHQLKEEKSDLTVVMFFVTKRDFYSIKPEVLQSRAVMEEIRQTCDAIQRQVGKRLFFESTVRQDHRLPQLNDFVDEYWKLRYRRTIQSWKSNKMPLPVTHKLVDEDSDDILQFLVRRNLLNRKEDKVKIVYHPDFINSTNPLFGMDYSQFVRGCHLGIFPSYYEPWGYTPLECMASGVPAVTSDLSGFGDYLLHKMPDHERGGMFVVERGKRTFDWSARQLAVFLHKFLQQDRRSRITQRNNVESYSSAFDWDTLIVHYEEAYHKLLSE